MVLSRKRPTFVSKLLSHCRLRIAFQSLLDEYQPVDWYQANTLIVGKSSVKVLQNHLPKTTLLDYFCIRSYQIQIYTEVRETKSYQLGMSSRLYLSHLTHAVSMCKTSKSSNLPCSEKCCTIFQISESAPFHRTRKEVSLWLFSLAISAFVELSYVR